MPGSAHFAKKFRLKHRNRFRKLFQATLLGTNPCFWVRSIPNALSWPRLGLVLTKKKFLERWTAIGLNDSFEKVSANTILCCQLMTI